MLNGYNRGKGGKIGRTREEGGGGEGREEWRVKV